MTKVAGRAASYAPSTAGAAISALALGGALLLGAGVAQAGTCTPTSSGYWSCVGAASTSNPSTDTTQSLYSPSNLNMTIQNGFGLNVQGGTGFNLNAYGASGDIVFDGTNGGDISATGKGISARLWSTNISGNIDISTSGAVVAGNVGIEAKIDGTGNTGDIDIVTSSSVEGGDIGIYAVTKGTGDVSIMTLDLVKGNKGIIGVSAGEGNVGITAGAHVEAWTGTGIYAEVGVPTNTINPSNYTGDIDIAATSVTASSGTGIEALAEGDGNVTVTATGNVDAGMTGIRTNITNSNAAGDITVEANQVEGNFYGISALNAGTGDVSINTTGAITAINESGIFAEGNSDVFITASGDVTGGLNGAGIETKTDNAIGSGPPAGPVGTAHITLNSGAIVSATSGTAITNDDGDSDIVANMGSEIYGEIALGGGSDDLTFAGSDFTGVTIFDGGAGSDTLTFAGTNGALLGSDAINWEVVNVDAGSTIDLSGTLTTWNYNGQQGGTINIGAGGTLQGDNAGNGFNLIGDVNNMGTLSVQNGDVNDTITVQGDYNGDNSASPALLVDVDFATNDADTLNIIGNIFGTTFVSVDDVSTGGANGIDVLVVDVTGVTNVGDFVLSSGPISSGAFVYDLGLDNSQWLLQSEGINASGATYDAASSILLGFADLPTLEQRVGQRQWLSLEDEGESLAPKEGLWLRFEGDKLNYNAGNSASGYQYDRQSWGAQVGWDYSVDEREKGHWVLGLTAQYGSMGGAVTNAFGTGNVDADGFGIGATSTWYGNNGTYFDAQAQINWLDSDYSSSTAGALASGQSATAYALGMEVGHRFELDGQRNLIPQAQIMWGRLDSDGFTDSAGNAVNFASANSLIGRLGLAYEFEHSEGQLSDEGSADVENLGNSTKTYVIGNILHQFSDTSVNVAGTNLVSGNDATWAEIGFGGSVAWDDEGSLFAEGSYRTSLSGDSKGSHGWSINAGYRISW